MPSALILSSHVAASRVGGTVQSLALAMLGIDPLLVPTVLFGRHPGWGPPGGGATPDAIFAGMIEGVKASGALAAADLIITGYFASAAQVDVAAEAIDEARRSGPPPLVLIDPVMGDFGKGLYVRPEVAKAIARDLVPRADLISPNAWELERLTGLEAAEPTAAVAAARFLGKPALISSVRTDGRIGVVYADRSEAWLAGHPPLASAPSGTGDLLTALFAVRRLSGDTPAEALETAVGGLVLTLEAAAGLGELPVVAMGARLGHRSPSVRLERLD